MAEEYKGLASVDLAVASQPELLLPSPMSPTPIGMSLRFPGERHLHAHLNLSLTTGYHPARWEEWPWGAVLRAHGWCGPGHPGT